MSGITKHIFDQEVRDILSMWDCEIKTIQPLLPKEYSKSDIIALLKEFYPYEWCSVEGKYTYYQTKDRCKTECKYYQENIAALVQEMNEIEEAEKVLKAEAERDYWLR